MDVLDADDRRLGIEGRYAERDIVQVCFFFNLILYLPSTIFQLNRDRSSWVEPVLGRPIHASRYGINY